LIGVVVTKSFVLAAFMLVVVKE